MNFSQLSRKILAPFVAAATSACSQMPPPSIGQFPHSSNRVALTVDANPFGQFKLPASANGVYDFYMFDTGATYVSFPARYVTILGLKPEQLHVAYATTANGVIPAAIFTLDKFKIGPCEFTHVKASIHPGLSYPLLGMSVIRQTAIIIENNKLGIICNASDDAESKRPTVPRTATSVNVLGQ